MVQTMVVGTKMTRNILVADLEGVSIHVIWDGVSQDT